jgi:Asp-tRNA(Asn)/Glu-tRNA(Gln) amidotransferase A subunit family amidase
MTGSHTISQAARDLRDGHTSPQTLVESSLARIEQFDVKIHAWALVDRDGATSAAKLAARELATGQDRGPLHGIPVGIKDIVDVAGMPTRAGSTLTDPTPARADAAVVALLREAGAIILGKTVTT